MSNPLVSAIITTYKRDFEILEKSIISVLEQTYRPIELIVVDDNVENSEYRKTILENLKKYPDIIHICHPKNFGAQRSRNDGILKSNGEYLAFLDDDDLWMKDKIQEQYNAFSNEVGLVYSKGYMMRWNADKNTYDRSPYNMSSCFIKELDFCDMLYGDYIGTTTQAMISRAAIAACGLFDTDQLTRQDYEMWIRISKRMKCVGVDEYLFEHFIHSGDQISKDMTKSALGCLNIFRKYRYDYKKYHTAKSHIFLQIAVPYKLSRKYFKALKYYILSGLALISAVFCDRTNLKKRMSIHKSRIS